jgi:hypothetical protein
MKRSRRVEKEEEGEREKKLRWKREKRGGNNSGLKKREEM